MISREIDRIAKAIKELPHDGITRAELVDIIGQAVIIPDNALAWAKWVKACGYHRYGDEGEK